jgi:hypothetical protein
MRRFFLSLAVVLGVAVGGVAQAGGPHGRNFDRGHDGGFDRHPVVHRDFDRHEMGHRDFDRHEFFREHGVRLGDGYFFRGQVHPDWSFRCWSPVYRCYFYWYPELSCYYYWSDAYGCWYPVSYMGTVPPSGDFPGMAGVPTQLPPGVPPPPGMAGPMVPGAPN